MTTKLQFHYEPFKLSFKRPSGTSRGILTEKIGWIIRITDNQTTGIGECSIIEGLSPDFTSIKEYEAQLEDIRKNLDFYLENLTQLTPYPSILFGIESALLDFKNGGKQLYFDTPFTRKECSISINGLIWMGEESFLKEQILEKIDSGYHCLKLKIGALDFQKELEILEFIRTNFDSKQLELRVDANGAFSPNDALSKLHALSAFELHSIEQPIKAGQWHEMKALCQTTPVPIALDEELIGVFTREQKKSLLETIAPQYIILKPSLHGGISGVQEWIELAASRNIPWWMTSALESNIGLNVIAQFASTYPLNIPQGLGTGSLYTSNFESKLTLKNGILTFN